MAKTSTVHNPVNFEPADYEVLDYLDNKRPQYYGQGIPALEAEIADWEAEMLRVLGADWRKKIHHCVHCGNARVRWITAVHHRPTDQTVVFGAVCTDRLGFENKKAFKLAQLQARAEARKVRFTIWNKREQYLADNPAIKQALTDITLPVHAKNAFAADVLRKLDQYGSLSDAQRDGVVASMARDLTYAAQKAAEATEPKGDAPVGRQEITGLVLSTKVYEGAYGDQLKMLVKLANNAKVWLSVPSGSGIARGDTVTVRATFEVSRDDKSFSFGKRPHLVNRTPATPAVSA